jgi:hypothetical protein
LSFSSRWKHWLRTQIFHSNQNHVGHYEVIDFELSLFLTAFQQTNSRNMGCGRRAPKCDLYLPSRLNQPSVIGYLAIGIGWGSNAPYAFLASSCRSLTTEACFFLSTYRPTERSRQNYATFRAIGFCLWSRQPIADQPWGIRPYFVWYSCCTPSERSRKSTWHVLYLQNSLG